MQGVGAKAPRSEGPAGVGRGGTLALLLREAEAWESRRL